MDALNSKWMPYVSRAKSLGGPTLLKAVGPALLTNKWVENSQEIKNRLVERFGLELTYEAAKNAVVGFVQANVQYTDVVMSRFKEIYE